MTEQSGYRGAQPQGVLIRRNLAEAIAARDLIDVSRYAQEAGFVWPATISPAVNAALVPTPGEFSFGRRYSIRLRDLFFLGRLAAQRTRRQSCEWTLSIQRLGNDRETLHLWTRVFLDTETGRPAFTVLLREEA